MDDFELFITGTILVMLSLFSGFVLGSVYGHLSLTRDIANGSKEVRVYENYTNEKVIVAKEIPENERQPLDIYNKPAIITETTPETEENSNGSISISTNQCNCNCVP